MTPKHFLYIADPLCSWCYGFAPVITQLAEHFDGRLPVKMIMGGLRAGNTQAMRKEDKDYIRSAWTRVNAATGQPFDHAFFEREKFVYDTEPACRAVVTARLLKPSMALHFKSRISQAFYAENRDMTATDEIVAVAEEAGFDVGKFHDTFLAPATRNATAQDFMIAKDMGIEGFPCLAVGNDVEGLALITKGYRPIDGMIEGIEKWLKSGAVLQAANTN